MPLVLANKQAIIDNERYFFCDDIGAFICLLPMGGGGLPLGFLIKLWDEGGFTDTCPDCGGLVYLLWSGGSLMSGSGSREGYCGDCRRTVRYPHPQWKSIFSLTLKKLKELRRLHPIEVVIPGKRQTFDWGKGLIGEATPDIVVKPRVIPAAFEDIVAGLGGKTG